MEDTEIKTDEFLAEQQKTEKARRAVKALAVIEGNTAGYSPVVAAVGIRKAKWVVRVEGHSGAALGVIRTNGDHCTQLHANPDAYGFWMGGRLQVSGGIGSSGRSQGPDELRLPADVELHLDAEMGTMTVRAHGAIFGFMETLPTHVPMRLVVGTGHPDCKVTLLSFADLEHEGAFVGEPSSPRDASQALMRGYGATTEELRKQVDELRRALWIERRGRERTEEELRKLKEEDSHVAPLQLGGLFNPMLSLRTSRGSSMDLGSSPDNRVTRRSSTGSLPPSTANH